MSGGDLVIIGEIDLHLNNKAFHSEECFKEYIEKPILRAGGWTPRFKGWQSYIESVAMLANTTKYLGPIPTKSQIQKFKATAQILMDQLEQKEFIEHYDKLYTELIMSGETTRALIEKRLANPKKKKITDDLKLKICDNLRRYWWHFTKSVIKGSYDNKNSDIPGNEDEQNLTNNPGAYFVQKVFDVYLGAKLNNRQLRSLIEETEKKYNTTDYQFPLTYELIDTGESDVPLPDNSSEYAQWVIDTESVSQEIEEEVKKDQRPKNRGKDSQ